MSDATRTPPPESRIDACPSCVLNTEAPWYVVRVSGKDYHCLYTCKDCGHEWTTDWRAA